MSMKKLWKALIVCMLAMTMFVAPALADITLMTNDTTTPWWAEMEALIEEATGVQIEAITSPSNPDDRVAKFTTILASGDSSIDLIHINDEMITQYMAAGFLAPLENDVMNPEVAKNFDQNFMQDRYMLDGSIYGVPTYNGALTMWVNQDMLDAAGVGVPTNKDEFVAAIKAMSNPEEGVYGYGGAWEATYSHNEIGVFINLFGGDAFDWTNEKSREGLQFMYDMANTWQSTSLAQLSEQYEPMNQKFFDKKYGIILQWCGWMESLAKDAGLYSPDQVHMIAMPTFETSSAFMDAWYYVLNQSSENYEEAKKVLDYIASPEFELAHLRLANQPPARSDVLNGEEVKGEEYSAFADLLSNLQLYHDNSVMRGRPMVPATMEYITVTGTLFQQYILNEISLDELGAQQLAAYESMK
jgi:multiple sugar transport system substrate-binding protein